MHLPKFLSTILTAVALFICAQTADAASRPNILWLSTEDIGMHLGCYGDDLAYTPNLDAFAERGIRYTNFFTTAGVCAPNRSAIITGMYASTLGTQHMRSGGEGVDRSSKPELPPHIRPFSAYMREAGYYCTNNSKEDYNFQKPSGTWDESSGRAHWKNRRDDDQPFFAVFNYTNTHEGSVRASPEGHARKTERLSPDERQNAEVNVPPPFHPDTPVVRDSWAGYRELITGMDYWFADRLAELDEAGVADNTIVFFWSDHGTGLPRGKRWLYDSGTHVPLMVYIPEALRKNDENVSGVVEDRLVSSVDLAPTVLDLAGIEIPDHIQGRPFLGSNISDPPKYVYGARDRMDERYDIIRTVRDKRYRYVRNYEPFKPYDQFMTYAERSPVKQEFHRLAAEGELQPHARWVAQDSKPAEELYDLHADPHEVYNVAGDPRFQDVLARFREAHRSWAVDSRDLGLIPEPELNLLGKRFGHRTAIWPSMEEEHPGYFADLREAAKLAGEASEKDVPELLSLLDNEHPSIRYWAATGLRVAGVISDDVMGALEEAFEDSSGTVRVAAARGALTLREEHEAALNVLTAELRSGREWVRLHAALALDALDEKARPAIPELKAALEDKVNKYVVRVSNRALNQLLDRDGSVR